MTGPESTVDRRRFLGWLAFGAVAAAAALVPAITDRRAAPGRAAPGAPLAKGPPDAVTTNVSASPAAPVLPGDPSGSDLVDVADRPTDPTVDRIEVVCREATGLVPARPDVRGHTVALLTLHHTAVRLDDPRRAPSRLRGHQTFHMQQGWSDVAYHYGVDPAGNVYELRDPAVPGDTFTDYDPTGHLLVVCEGDYTVDEPTEVMIDTLAGLFAHASARLGVSLDTLGGHRDHASTRCPGDRLAGHLDEIRERAARRTAPVLTRVCGPDGEERIRAIETG